MELTSDKEIRKIPRLLDEFLRHVAPDYEPLFIGDEATVWDLSMDSAEEVRRRCSEHYGIVVSMEELDQPLWELISQLNQRRSMSGGRL